MRCRDARILGLGDVLAGELETQMCGDREAL
jgi:hypothetical protein